MNRKEPIEYGRRTVVKEADREEMRTLYDGAGWEVDSSPEVARFTSEGSVFFW
jgi:hypothetical protein